MSEIEKMYENANIKAKEYCDRDSDACMTCCPEWENRQDCRKYKSVMPPFTAEKQLSLIIWLSHKSIEISDFFIDIKDKREHCVSRHGLQFEDALAQLINLIWQDLTDEEKAEIRGILECSYKEK